MNFQIKPFYKSINRTFKNYVQAKTVAPLRVTVFLENKLNAYLFLLIADCAAAKRAMGTR